MVLSFGGYRISGSQEEQSSMGGWWRWQHNNVNVIPLNCTLING